MSTLCISTVEYGLPAIMVPSDLRRQAMSSLFAKRSRLQHPFGDGAYLRFTSDGVASRGRVVRGHDAVLPSNSEVKLPESQHPFGDGAYLRFTSDGNRVRNALRHR